MKKPPTIDYSEEETARRRDEVIRRMTNTPPTPRVKPPVHQSGKKKPTGQDRKSRGAGKDRA